VIHRILFGIWTQPATRISSKKLKSAQMELRSGDIVADVGCGTGEDVLALAMKVGAAGRAIGVDLSSTMIATAGERSRQCGLKVSFVQRDVQKLGFEDGCFDALRAERALQHTADPTMALREMVRVLKPGGRLVSWEADLDLFVIDARITIPAALYSDSYVIAFTRVASVTDSTATFSK
jgi:ubiquinone/menaquinone biosynthesis C-methylase UbiE